MSYVYILQSINVPDQLYIGWTTDLRHRLAAHRIVRLAFGTEEQQDGICRLTTESSSENINDEDGNPCRSSTTGASFGPASR